MTNPDECRAATTDKLALLALDLSATPADAVSVLMRAAAHILDLTLGSDATANLMHDMTGEALRAWQATCAAQASTTAH